MKTKDMNSLGLRVDSGRLLILDQTLLPVKEVWLESRSPGDMIGFIRALKVRGAPLIGVAAALELARFADGGASRDEVVRAAKALREARPTAVNLMIAIDRMLAVPTGALRETAEAIFHEDVALCASMAEHGAALVRNGDGLLTHCNAGGLATAGIGTAVGVIRRAHEQGKRLHVYVDETRPLLQGGRLTAWELFKLGIPHTLICDNMAPILMKAGKIQRIFVGSDRIALNGDFANKVGTYGVAVSAKHHGVPLSPVAPYTTIDFECETGDRIPIEERASDEVRGASGAFGTPVFNPSFDVTPVELVDRMVLDSGVYTQSELKTGALLRLRERRTQS